MPAVNMRQAKTKLSRLGVAKGRFVVPDDIDAHNSELARLFQGGGAV